MSSKDATWTVHRGSPEIESPTTQTIDPDPNAEKVTSASSSSPGRHNSARTEGTDAILQQILKETMQKELSGRIFELTHMDHVTKLVPPKRENDLLAVPFDDIETAVKECLEVDSNWWKKAGLPKGEKASYAPWVDLLNAILGTLATILERDEFREYADLWDNLQFIVYDREVKHGVDNAKPLKPDCLALVAHLMADFLLKEKDWINANKSKGQESKKVADDDEYKGGKKDFPQSPKIGWPEGPLVSEVKENSTNMLLQAATYARGLFDALYLLFVPVILFNHANQVVQFVIFTRGFTIVTPEISTTLEIGFGYFVKALLQIPRWTKASKNPELAGTIILPPRKGSQESLKFDFESILAFRLSVVGSCTRVSKFINQHAKGNMVKKEPTRQTLAEISLPRTRPVTRSVTLRSTQTSLLSWDTESAKFAKLSINAVQPHVTPQHGLPSPPSSPPLNQDSPAFPRQIDRLECFNAQSRSLLETEMEHREGTLPESGDDITLVESLAWKLEKRVDMEFVAMRESRKTFGLVQVISALRLQRSTADVLPVASNDILCQSRLFKGKQTKTPQITPEHRVLTRVVMQYYDRTLYAATGPRQAFIATRHALIGMLALFEKGLNQRDWSPGNVLISDKADTTLELPSIQDPQLRHALKPVLAQAKEDGCIGHLADFDHMVKINRTANDLAKSQSGTWVVLAVRIAQGWGTPVLQTIIDNLEASTWSLIWTFLCNGPKTPANALWKSWLEGLSYQPKQTLLSNGTKHESKGYWRQKEPVPPSIRPFLKFFCKIFMLGEKYAELLDNILVPSNSQNKPQLDEKTDQEVISLTHQAFIDYLQVYFDDGNLELMTEGWPDVDEDKVVWGEL